MRRIRSLLGVVVAVATLGMVGVQPASAAPATTTAGGVVWLCRPGLADDPCTPSLTTTRTSAAGKVLGVEAAPRPTRPTIDCFYVYPTVSDQKTPNADLTVDPTERSIALFQVARFSEDCRVFAPMYRQLTLSTLGGQTTAEEDAVAYDGVLAAWRAYLREYNGGRGVVLIGHSQGAYLLRHLIATQIDPDPSLRHRLVSALLMGGNVLVKAGSGIGGDFHHIPACRAAAQTGCVIAYSTFDAVPPAGSFFGRSPTPGTQVLCTNPASLAGGTGVLDPILPSRPFAPGSTIAAGIAELEFTVPPVATPWVSVPGAYSAHCTDTNGASVLEVTPRNGAPLIHSSPTPGWGLHLVDVNLALGNLVAIVHTEAGAYRRTR